MDDVQIFEVETGEGTKRISVKSTGTGAWVTISAWSNSPWTTIRPATWIANANEIASLLEKAPD